MQEDILGIYERSILVNNKSIGSVEDFLKLLSLKSFQTNQIGDNDRIVIIGQFESTKEPIRSIENKAFMVKKGLFNYEIYIIPFSINGALSFILTAPNPKVLDELSSKIESSNLLFIACELKSICNSKYYEDDSEFISITRINAQVPDEKSKINSIGLYGPNVIKSETLKKIFTEPVASISLSDGGPFNPKNHHPSIIPNSIKLVYDDGSNSKFSLNIDKFGNCSFYLRNIQNFQGLMKIMNQLEERKSFQVSLKINPVKRDPSALQAVEDIGKI